MAASGSSDVEPWRVELDEQIADEKSWGNEQNTEAAEILLEMFLSYPQTGHLASLKAALRIAADYWAKFLPSSQDPLNKPYMMEDKGMSDYLSRFYELIFYQSWLLRHDDPRQDLLVRLLADLRNLPKVTYKSESRQKEYHAFYNDPVFLMMSDEYWNAKFSNVLSASHYSPSADFDPESDRPEPKNPQEKKDFHITCDEWINFSAFQARYCGSGAFGPGGGSLKFPSIDIPLAFEKDLPAGRLGECRILVASNWIIHAGKIIRDSMEKKSTDGWDLQTWKRWSERITEILKSAKHSEEVTSALEKAFNETDTIGLGGE
ncbi:hypothetical protein CSOJ01_09461 [Colletotrichum sojae]|uniref:Uncharacterized protein n=1 Tax=Colletotrichum sojae TaxID=2175907 RepID=A0A8H6J330_9PEZI|nr:hypothetical protein CSOJ01_09461 [Colletotrichum sojae]